MNNTEKSFSDKWHKNVSLALKHTLDPNSEINQWIIHRNGFKDNNDLKSFLKNKNRILDAGCGNGRVTGLLRSLTFEKQTSIVGIDISAHDVAKENLKEFENISFFQKDLKDNLSDLGLFDFIYCQEVLHHTGNPELSFKNLTEILQKDGEIAIYVYKKKAPIREYTDDYIREKIKDLGYNEAMKICSQITELGRVLSQYNINIDLPNVEVLGIKEGTYSLQRFVYHFFAKNFWNDEFNFEENNVINYDWYHPQDCTRHTIEEVRKWFLDNNLSIDYEFEDFYGITMRGRKS
jgi:SAM-dependent methyltransferase